MRPRDWLDRLERHLGEWAVPDPALFLVGMNAVVWALSLLKPGFELRLDLDPALVLSGQVWRLATFLFIPPAIAPLWMIFWLLLFYAYAQALENEWGEFRFCAFYGIGAAATALVSVALGAGLSNVPLNLSLFLAFADLYPDVELLLFFIIPVKVRWLAWLAWAGVAAQLLFGGWGARIALGAGLFNYVLFFGPDHWQDLRQRLERRRRR
ncbi:MAG: hypothetical protein KGL53_01835 [Elusimicrobia bacterium]|nr:hypothetical protein [Elusimicrobiota bacterium]